MHLEAELDRLYQRPLKEFIAARNELSKALRQDGDKEEAARVKALTKPSLTAWAVNQLHYQAPAELEHLTEVGERVRQAHLLGPDEHREAMKARREAISTLLGRAADILEEGGHPPSRAHRQRISQTLEALASGNGEAGRLSQDLDPPGFDVLAGLAASLGSPALVKPSPKAPPAGKPAEPKPFKKVRSRKSSAVTKPTGTVAEPIDFQSELRRREQEREEKRRQQEIDRERQRQQLERRVVEAREALERLEAQAVELDSEVTTASARLAEAEARQAEADAAAQEAERLARKARTQAAEAAKATHEARRQVASVGADQTRTAAERREARLRLESLERELQPLKETD